MQYTLELVDVVANAFIESMKLDKTVRSIEMSVIEKYAHAVANYLKEREYDVHEDLSQYAMKIMIGQYGDIFEVDNEQNIVSLKNGCSMTVLENRFRTCLLTDVLLAFINKDIVKEIFCK